MVSKTAEYALRATVWLAAHPQRAYAGHEIAAGTRVPPDYLAKVLKGLGRAGLIRAQPGRGGGFSLARPAGETAILEVINAVEPLQRIKACPLGLAEHSRHLCPLHCRLDAIAALMEDAFRSATLAELLADAAGPGRPCAFPRLDRFPASAAGRVRKRRKRTGQRESNTIV